MLARSLDVISHLAFIGAHSRAARLARIVLLAAAVVCISLARPASEEQKRIGDIEIRDITTLTLGRYVRVTGTLAAERAYQVQVRVGGVELRGSRYIPLIAPSSADPLFVLDEGLPAGALGGRPVTLVGQVVEGVGRQPTYYLQIGDPPNVQLMNTLARAGLIVAALTLAAILIIWLIQRQDFAVPVAGPGALAPRAPELLWYGSVGKTYSEATVRGAAVALDARRREASFTPAGAAGNTWTISVRRLREAAPATIATRHGALAAARLTYEDERGLVNRAVLAANSPQARDAVVEVLRHVGNV